MEYVLLNYVASQVLNGFNNFDRINEHRDTNLYDLGKFTLIPTLQTAFLTLTNLLLSIYILKQRVIINKPSLTSSYISLSM